MALDSANTGLGLEIASLRALGEGRRRRSLADRLLRERRDVVRLGTVIGTAKSTIDPSPALHSSVEAWKSDGPHRLD
jgi:hypothetical protein